MVKSWVLPAALAGLVLAAGAAQAGGEMGDAKGKDEGAHFFGFVRDAAGKPVFEAKVTAELKNGTRYVTRTAKNGMYRFGGFNKSVTADDVTISCSKEKMKQARVVRKTPANARAAKSVEVECRLRPE